VADGGDGDAHQTAHLPAGPGGSGGLAATPPRRPGDLGGPGQGGRRNQAHRADGTHRGSRSPAPAADARPRRGGVGERCAHGGHEHTADR
jgi:hypothetical protein